MPLNPRPKRYTILFRAVDLVELNTTREFDTAVDKLGYMALLDDSSFAFYNPISGLWEPFTGGGGATLKEKAHYWVSNNATPTGFGGWAGTYTKVEGSTSFDPEEINGFDMTGDNIFTYTGIGVNKQFAVSATLTGFLVNDPIISNQLTFRVAVNGVDSPVGQGKIVTAIADEFLTIGSVHIKTTVWLNPGDYVEIYMTNNSANYTIKVDMNVLIEEF